MRISRRAFSLCVMFLFIGGSAMVFAHGSQEKSAAAQKTTTVTFLTVQQKNIGETMIIGQLAKQYEKSHPNVKYQYQYVPQTNLDQKVQLLSSSNSLPTLYPTPPEATFMQMVKKGEAVNIETAFKKLGILNALNPSAISLVKGLEKSKSGMYQLPFELNIEGFWYNKKIFAQNNLSVPTTWKEMLNDAAILKKNGIQPFAVDGHDKWPITRLIGGYLIREYGPKVMDRVAAGSVSVTEPGFVKAAQTIADMGSAGYFGRGVTTIQYNPALDLFAQGKAAMYYMGSWAIRQFNDPKVDTIGVGNIGLFNIPVVQGGKGTLNQWEENAGLLWAMSKKEYTPSVANWAKYVFSRYGQKAMSEEGMITGFKVSTLPAKLSPVTKLVQKRIDSAKETALWFEARFNSKEQQVAWNNAQLLATGSMNGKQYMDALNAALTGN